MALRKRLHRPVRESRKMKTGRIQISRAADRTIRELARIYNIKPEVVLGLLITFEVARFRMR